MKYEIGDFVSKPVTGVCKIVDILYLTTPDEKIKYDLYENQGSFHSNLLSERSLFLCDVSVKMKER